MDVVQISNEGKVLIPEALRTAHHWAAGQELTVIDVGDGILLKPKTPFLETTLEDVAGCLRFQGEPKSLDDFEEAIRLGVTEQFDDRR